MTNMNLLQAMGRIDPKLIADAAPDVVQKKTTNQAGVKMTLLAACLAFVVAVGVISGGTNTNIGIAAVVIDYGRFIFVPVLLVSLISSCFSFTTRNVKPNTFIIINTTALVMINLLNVLGVHLYPQLGGINIIGYIPIILISSNAGAIVSIIMIMLLDRKIKALWIKLLLWLLVSVISIIFAGMVHNVIFPLLQCGMVMTA